MGIPTRPLIIFIMYLKKLLHAPLFSFSVEAPDPFNQPVCDAVDDFFNSVETPGPDDIEEGISRVPVESVLKLTDATQSYCVRALFAENACRNNLIVGLAGGAIIGAGIVSLVYLIRRHKKRNAA